MGSDELHYRFREGQEEQLSALGLVTNVMILWNTIDIEAALNQLRNEAFEVLDADVARLSPLIHEHINMLGRCSFVVTEAVTRGASSETRKTILKYIYRSIATHTPNPDAEAS